MPNSRQKGKRGELDARDAVREHWFAPDCIRSAQANGKYGADLLNALPGGHVEVKRYAKIGALRFLDQARKDSREAFPVVLMREDGTTAWAVLFPIDMTDRFVQAYLLNKQRTSNGAPRP